MEGSFGSFSARIVARERLVVRERLVRVSAMGLIVIGLGLVAGVTGWILLRRSGSGWRVGRLLAAAPRRTLAEAVAAATAGEASYVRLHGRIDSDEEFSDEQGRPIVFRRRRLQQRLGRGPWQTFDDERQAVPFRLQEAGERVAIDIEALGDGLVVVPRESEGVAADLARAGSAGPASAETSADLAPETPVRLRIEQVSSIEHATAAGVPRVAADGSVVLGPGLGRPLVLTTLDVDEAMRLLAGDRRTRLLVASGLLAAAPIVIIVGLVVLVISP